MAGYRQPVLERLSERLDGDLLVLTGDEDFEPTSRTEIDLGPVQRRVENRYLLGRRLLWQSGCLKSLIAARVAVLELNPRMLSSWAALPARRALRRPTVLWGHAFPRAGREASTDRLRGLMRRVADVLVVYTETERRQLLELHPGARVLAAPNGIYPSTLIGPRTPGGREPDAFAYVGRLVPTKKPRLLLDAFLLAREGLPEGTRLVIAGDGPLRAELEAMAAGAGADVTFLGHVTDYDRLAELYAGAIASVSPGYVGLSIVQSLSFGVPMIVARDEPHAPEVEAAREGVNCRFVESDSPAALAAALRAFGAERGAWLERRGEIAAECARRYSADATAAGLHEAILAAAGRA
jgi:glycosyltransferase involved in cell wall biosynthesis